MQRTWLAYRHKPCKDLRDPEGKVLAPDLHDLIIGSERSDRIDRKAEPLPFVVTASQRANALNPQLIEGHGGLGRGIFAGAGAEQHDVSVSRYLEMTGGERI